MQRLINWSNAENKWSICATHSKLQGTLQKRGKEECKSWRVERSAVQFCPSDVTGLMQLCLHTHTKHTHACVPAQTHKHMLVRTQTVTGTYIHAHTHMHVHIYSLEHIHTHERTKNTQTHVFAHADMYTCAHTHINMQARACTNWCRHMHTCTHMHMHTYSRENTHMNTHAHGHKYTHVNIHTLEHAHTWMHTHGHTHAYAHIHICTCTHMGTYTYIHVYRDTKGDGRRWESVEGREDKRGQQDKHARHSCTLTKHSERSPASSSQPNSARTARCTLQTLLQEADYSAQREDYTQNIWVGSLIFLFWDES